MATLKTKLLLRNDTTANWSASNPVLSKGEMGIEWTTSGATGVEGKCKLKLGDGYTDWNNLDYIGGDTVKIVTSGSGNTVVGLSSSEDNGIITYTLTLGNRVIGSQTTTTTLGDDDTTVPTSKAVKDAIGDLVTGVSSVKVTDDDVVIGTPSTATSGAVTINVKHATKGPSSSSDTTVGPTDNVTISGSGASGSVVIPYITVDKYGHTTGLTEKTLSITMPSTTNMVTGTGLTANTIILGNGSSKVKTSSKTITTTLGSDDTTVPTSKAVTTAIAAATNAAVVMRGTLGTGGTITALPTASSSTLGDAYKVITEDTYAGQSAKVGDVFICYQPTSSTYGWMLIPSGDDIEDTWRAIQVNGTEVLGMGTSTGALNLKAGSNVSLAYDNGTVTIASSYTNSRDPGYGKITPANSTAATALTGNTTQIAATTYNEAVKFSAANKWIVLAGTNNGSNSDEMKWGHSLSGVTAGNYGESANVTLSSSDKNFILPYVTVDAAGHATSVKNVTVTLPDTAFVNTTYDVVSTSANGLAPKMTTANAFLARVGSAGAPTWNSLVVLDGGSASTTDWGTITA